MRIKNVEKLADLSCKKYSGAKERKSEGRVVKALQAGSLVIGLATYHCSAYATAMPAISPLPKGVPATTKSTADCVLPSEKAAYKAYLDENRIKVTGCDVGVIQPSAIHKSQLPYITGTTTYDCVKVRDNYFNSAYADQYLSELTKITDEVGTDPRKASCAANMIYTWAHAGAMTSLGGSSASQAEKDRMWTFAGISTAYLINSEVQVAAKRMNKEASILRWMRNIARSSQSKINEYIAEDATPKGHGYSTVNTQFWRAYSILPAAILLEDASLLNTSRLVFDTALRNIAEVSADGKSIPEDEKGLLPRELARTERALNYHNFAMLPIVSMASLSRSFGCDFMNSEWSERQVARALGKGIEGIYSPAIFTKALKEYGYGNFPVLIPGSDSRILFPLLTSFRTENVKDLVQAHLQATVGKGLEKSKNQRDPRLGGSLIKFATAVEGMKGRSSEALRKAAACNN